MPSSPDPVQPVSGSPLSPPSDLPQLQKVSNPKIVYLITTFILSLGVIIILFLLWINYGKTAPTNSSVTQVETASQSAQLSSPRNSTPLSVKLSMSVTVESSDSGKIRGTISVKNPSSTNLASVYAGAVLNTTNTTESTININNTPTKMTVVTAGGVVNFSESASFALAANSTKTQNFEIPYSSNIKSGQYEVTAYIFDQQGNKLTSTGTNLSLSGNGSYLTYSNTTCSVLIDGKSYDPTIAPLTDPNQVVQGRCTYQNPSSSPLTLKFKTDYAVLSLLSYPDSKKLTQSPDQIITFAPKETKDITFNLPAQATPGVYENWLTLLDSQNQAISLPVTFRFTVKGASSRVEEVDLDRDYYASGDTAKVTVSVDPSLDMFWRNNPIASNSANLGTVIQNPNVSVDLVDKDGASCGTGSVSIPKTETTAYPSQEIKVKVNKNCLNPKAQVKVLDGSSLLVESAKDTTSSNQNITSQPTQNSQLKIILFTILGALIILIIACISLYYKKPGNGPPPSQILVLTLAFGAALYVFSATSAFGPSVKATIQNNGGIWTLNSTITDPSQTGIGSLGMAEWMCQGDCYLFGDGTGTYSVTYATSPSAAVIYINADITSGYCNNSPVYMSATINGAAVALNPSDSTRNYGDNHGGDTHLPTYSTYVVLSPKPTSPINVDFAIHIVQAGNDHSSTSGSKLEFTSIAQAIYPTWNGRWPANGTAPTFPFQGEVTIPFAPACTAPAPTSVCSGQSYSDNQGNSCTGTQASVCSGANTCIGQTASGTCGSTCAGTKQCDSTPPTGSITTPIPLCVTPGTWPATFSISSTDSGSSISGVKTAQLKLVDTANNAVVSTLTNTNPSPGTPWTTSFNLPFSSIPNQTDYFKLYLYLTDAAGNPTSGVPAYSSQSFQAQPVCGTPYIQTQNGDVHTQGNIQTH